MRLREGQSEGKQLGDKRIGNKDVGKGVGQRQTPSFVIDFGGRGQPTGFDIPTDPNDLADPKTISELMQLSSFITVVATKRSLTDEDKRGLSAVRAKLLVLDSACKAPVFQDWRDEIIGPMLRNLDVIIGTDSSNKTDGSSSVQEGWRARAPKWLKDLLS